MCRLIRTDGRLKELLELGLVGFRGEEAGQDSAVGGAVVAVVEQADGPVVLEVGEELFQGAGSLVRSQHRPPPYPIAGTGPDQAAGCFNSRFIAAEK